MALIIGHTCTYIIISHYQISLHSHEYRNHLNYCVEAAVYIKDKVHNVM